jgi:hypothetical protein
MLVTLDVTHERWRSYPLEDVEVMFTRESGECRRGNIVWGTGGDVACVVPRRERLWRYAYRLGGENVRGIACIAETAGIGRSRVMKFLRAEAHAE